MTKIILIGGGSASGKTYVLHKVLEKLPKDKVTLISLDDYYKDFSVLPMEERAGINFDHPKAFDWPLLRSQIKDLKSGKSIDKPIYDFVIHGRKKETEKVESKELILIEGIMALVNKELRDMGDLKVFINASREKRLVRRINRDTKERGRTYESVVEQYFASVQPMFEEIIGPSQYYADLIINNEGVTNNSIDVLASVLNNMLDK